MVCAPKRPPLCVCPNAGAGVVNNGGLAGVAKRLDVGAATPPNSDGVDVGIELLTPPNNDTPGLGWPKPKPGVDVGGGAAEPKVDAPTVENPNDMTLYLICFAFSTLSGGAKWEEPC